MVMHQYRYLGKLRCHLPGWFIGVALLIFAAKALAAAGPSTRPMEGGGLPATRSATQAAKHVKLLAVGNSFSGNATRYLRDIVAASGNQLTFGHASIGGCSLQKHWALAQAFEKDPDDPTGRPYGGYRGKGKMSLKEYLVADRWDYVTLQQVSTSSYKVETFRPDAQNLFDYARKHAPQAQVVFHETWAYRADDPLFKAGLTDEQMYEGIRQAYATIAGELGAPIIPVGDAFQRARRDPAWKYVWPDPAFDFTKPSYPKLPDQTHSLNVGYTWKMENGKPVLRMDGHHANSAGEYLGAAVWFEFLYGQSVVGNTFMPKGLKPQDVAFLQGIAHETVQRPLSRPVPSK
jgi:hypothetical protein